MTESNFVLTATSEFDSVFHKESGRSIIGMITLKAPATKVDESKRAPVDIVTVIDRSGSMQGGKLDLVKRSTEFLIEQMTPNDRLGIIAYDDNVNVVSQMRTMDSKGKELAKSSLKTIYTGGSTNLCGGLEVGVDEIRKNGRRKSDSNVVSSTLLFTDGHANVGPTSAEGIMSQVRNPSTQPISAPVHWSWYAFNIILMGLPFLANRFRNYLPRLTYYPSPKSLPCTINTFGFGSDHDSSMMRTLAEKADGSYYYIATNDEIPKSFANCLGGLVSVVAQNITIEFEALNGATFDTFHTKYKTTESVKNKKYTIHLGDIQSEEQRDLLFTIKLPSSPEFSQEKSKYCKVTLQCDNVLTSSVEKSSIWWGLSRSQNSNQKTRNTNIDLEWNRVQAAKAMDESNRLADQGNLKEAKSILETEANRISDSISRNDPFCINLVKDLKRCAEKLNTNRDYEMYGKHMMSTNSYSHHYQRSSNMEWGGQERYSTGSRYQMTKKMALF